MNFRYDGGALFLVALFAVYLLLVIVFVGGGAG